MKKMGTILLMVLFFLISSRLYAPGGAGITSSNLEGKYDELIKNQINTLLLEIKSVETWHDSLNYKYGNPYKKINHIGAMGAWQFMPGTLRNLGYKDSTFKRFLNSPSLQRRYMLKLVGCNIKALQKKSKRYGITPFDYIGMYVDTIEITLSGLIGVSHLSGVGGAQRLLIKRRNASDGHCTAKDYLYKFRNIMNINPRTYEAYQLMHNGVLALARAEQQGIRVDIPFVESKIKYLTKRIDRLDTKFKDTNFYHDWEKSTPDGKVNVNSPIQLANFLYKVKGIQPPKFTRGSTEDDPKGSTDVETIKQLNIPELNLLIERDKLVRLRDVNLTSYLREQVDGYIHPFFNLHIPRTYRSSSSNPNFQNQPNHDEESMKICRGALYPRPGHQLMEIDYSGIEFRIIANYNKDKVMLNYINDCTSDPHGDMAKLIFIMPEFDKRIPSHKTLRQAAKNSFIFPELYGSYYKNCAANMCLKWIEMPKSKWKKGQGIELSPFPESFYLSDHLIANGIKSFDSFTNHMERVEDDFRRKFEGHWRWMESWDDQYRRNGYVDSLTGFRYSGVMKLENVINAPVQGSAFHCLLWSLIEVDKVMKQQNWNTKIIGQIHDSLVLDVNPREVSHVAKIAKRITCTDLPKAWDWIITPLDIDIEIAPIDKSWAEKEKFKLS